ncbi:hypothetical protein BGZ65_003814 [Modicella reniformis]|uniref:Uncharacterized protein n=1 Tax=Modicella reniformis TaxID=1440133 RepID=A0A9P6SLZ5_9FUNG|nr:hypothetical protein BGZ65_003814 [Modicella reniformis]
MPTAESMMQPISAPVPVPGSQREPTVPNIPLVSHTNICDTSNFSSGSGLLHNQHHNSGSGLRRFPSIGVNKKITVENTTLKAKVVELERYLAGLKEGLIEAHRQIRAQRQELNEQSEHIQKCEFELGAKILEYEDLKEQLAEKIPPKQSVEIDTSEGQREEENNIKDQSIQALQKDNESKDAQIAELLESLEREKAAKLTGSVALKNAPSSGWQTQSIVNSVGYDLAQEHPKLLAKFEALRMQHAMASVYIDDLEGEIHELKIQGLDINSGLDPLAY